MGNVILPIHQLGLLILSMALPTLFTSEEMKHSLIQKIFRVIYRHTKADTEVLKNTANEASYLDKFQVS